MKTVLVTGSQGFIGRNVMEILPKYGHSVIGLDRKDGAIIVHDLNNPLDWTPAVHVDAVIHLAAVTGVRSTGVDYTENIRVTQSIVNWCVRNGVRQLINASSSSVYGSRSDPMREAYKAAPISDYAKSKLLCEEWLRRTGVQTHGLNITNLRLFNAIGKHQREDMFPAIAVKRKLQNVHVSLYGNARRSWTSVDDIVRGIDLCLNTFANMNPRFVTLNMGSDKNISLKELLKKLETVAGSPVDYDENESDVRDVPTTLCDSMVTQHVLGWKPNPENVDAALSDLWIQRNTRSS